MPLDTSLRSARWVYLVQVLLTGVTKYYSNLPVVVDGQPYEARIANTIHISTQLSDVLNPRQTASNITLELRNHDQALTTLFDSYTWGNRVVRIYVGQGGVLSSGYSQVFEGRVRFPNGLRWNEEIAFVIVNDRRNTDSKLLPVNSNGAGSTPRYGTAEFSLLETKSLTTAKQILIGDYGTARSERIRAVCVNTTTREFRLVSNKFAPLSAIQLVYKQEGLTGFRSVTFTSPNLTLGSFILGVAYNPDKDVVTAHAKGVKTSGGTLIESPSRVIKYILQTHLGVATSGINQTAFNTLETATTGIKLRRHITGEIESSVLLEEISRECGLDVFIKAGQYHAQTINYLPGTSLTTFDQTDIVPGSFEVVDDPNVAYFNSVTVGYNFNPETGNYKKKDRSNATAISDVGATIAREFTFNWLYDDTDADSRMTSLLFMFGNKLLVVSVRLKHRALLHYLADRFILNYKNNLENITYFNNITCQIRDMDLDPEGMSILFTLYDSTRIIAYGKWAPDSIGAWSVESQANRDLYGWWTDNDGNIVAGDPNTALSLWDTG